MMRHFAFIALVFASVSGESFQNDPPYRSRFPPPSPRFFGPQAKETNAPVARPRSLFDEDRGGTAEPSSVAAKPSVTSPAENYGKTAATPPNAKPRKRRATRGLVSDAGMKSRPATTNSVSRTDGTTEPKAAAPDNGDGPGLKATAPSVYRDGPRQKSINFPDAGGVQESSATRPLGRTDGPEPKASTASVYGDGSHLRATGFANFGGGGLMVAPATPTMAFYGGRVPTNPSVFTPASTYQKLYLFNNGDVAAPAARSLWPDGRTSGATTTPDGVGNAISTTDKVRLITTTVGDEKL